MRKKAWEKFLAKHTLNWYKQIKETWLQYSTNKLTSKEKLKPLGVLIALENHTKFASIDKTYRMNKGDILCFSGDTLHAGAQYSQPNTRIHVYLDVDKIQRKKNTTWFPSIS